MARRGSAIQTPDFNSLGNSARSAANVGVGVPSPISLTPQAPQSAFSGIDMSKIGAVFDGIQKTRDTVKMVSAETAGQAQAVAKQAGLNPLDPDYQDQVKAIWDDAGKTAADGANITTPEIQAQLQERWTQLSAAAQISAIGIKKDAVSKDAIRVYGDASDGTMAKIRSDPGNADLYVKEFQGDAAHLTQGIDPTKIGLLSDKFANDVVAATVTGFADKGQLGAAKKALDAQHGALSNGQYTTLSNYIDGKQRHFQAEADRFQTQQLAGLKTDLNDKAAGNKPWEGNEREKIDDMYAKGIIGPTQHYDAVAYLNEAQKKDKLEQAKNAEAMTELKDGYAFTKQDNADRAFKQTVGTVPFSAIASQGSDDDWQKASAVGVAISEHGQYIPTDMKALLASADSTTDKAGAQFVGRAAQLADDMSPRAKSGLDLKSDGTLAVVRGEAKRLIDQGVPKVQAYFQAAQTQLSKGPMTVQEDKDRAVVAEKALSKPGYVDTAVKKAFDQGWFSSDPMIDDAVQKTFRDAYKSAQTSDPATREAVALDAVKHTWGVSEVGGSKQVVKYPPERFLPPAAQTLLTPDQQAEVIRTDVEGVLKSVNIPFSKNKDLPGLDPYRLVANDQTAADARAGRNPRYDIQVLRGDHYESIPGLPAYAVPQKLDGVPSFDQAVKENDRQVRASRGDYLNDQATGGAKQAIRQRGKAAIGASLKNLQNAP
jgi:hypothetical protein